MELFSNETLQVATGASGITVSLAWLARAIWRRVQKDNTENVKDRAEINIIETMQQQIATLIEENVRLRSRESDLSNRLGRLETKEKEAEEHVIMINKLRLKLEEKDFKIEEILISHAKETTRLMVLLEVKDREITELSRKIDELSILINKG